MTELNDDQGMVPSRSAKKRAAKEVEELARQLLELPDNAWNKLSTAEDIREEIALARQTQGHSSRKRQLKHLAGVLRRHEEEAEALRAFLDELHQVQRREKRDFHFLEQLRDRLCDPTQSDAALAEAVTVLPELDRAALARLARSAYTHGDRRASREIFRRLKQAWENRSGQQAADPTP
ncbi:MAG: ribosome biogenesis factor YjgA [Desulfuromonadaceae bacterium]